MKSPGQTTTIPLAYAAEISFELAQMRSECCAAAQGLMSQGPLDEHALEECARLDDALAKAHRLLESTLKRIHLSRSRRGKPAE